MAHLAMQVYTQESGKKEFRHFLDNQQYQTNGILRYERIFGQGYVSTGGFQTTKVGPGVDTLLVAPSLPASMNAKLCMLTDSARRPMRADR